MFRDILPRISEAKPNHIFFESTKPNSNFFESTNLI
jgi:hypothetical protein